MPRHLPRWLTWVMLASDVVLINLALYGETMFPRVTVADVKLHDELSKRRADLGQDGSTPED